MVEVIVYFGGVLYNGENAVRNSVTNTREEFPDSFRRQAEPISEHHKLTPVGKSEHGDCLHLQLVQLRYLLCLQNLQGKNFLQ